MIPKKPEEFILYVFFIYLRMITIYQESPESGDDISIQIERIELPVPMKDPVFYSILLMNTCFNLIQSALSYSKVLVLQK